MDLIFGALIFFFNREQSNVFRYQPHPIRNAEEFAWSHEVGGGVLDYLPVCSEDHSASMLRWDGLCSQKRTYSGGGDWQSGVFYFLIPYFPYYVYDTYSKGSQEGIYFPFSKNCLFNLGVCFFSRIWRVSTFNFCVVFVFSEIYLPFSFFFAFLTVLYFFRFSKTSFFFSSFFSVLFSFLLCIPHFFGIFKNCIFN